MESESKIDEQTPYTQQQQQSTRYTTSATRAQRSKAHH